MMLDTPRPTLVGFTAWVYQVMGVPADDLPEDSPTLAFAYDTALATVNPLFLCVPGPIYLQMVYNLGGHLLLLWASDVPGEVYITAADGQEWGFFAWQRKVNNMLGFTPGIVSSASDEGTSVSLQVLKQLDNLTLAQLGLLSTPWGRTYLGYAQDFGTNWGLS